MEGFENLYQKPRSIYCGVFVFAKMPTSGKVPVHAVDKIVAISIDGEG
jgi:hypothetical protein